jgi:hypothetical protein
MCNEKSHITLSQPEHFSRHAMELNRLRAVGRNLGTISVDLVRQEASDALTLADRSVDPECVHYLEQLVNDEIELIPQRGN